MKKFFCVAALLCAVLSIVFAQNGVIRELSGDVQLKPAGASNFVTAQAGNEVAQNTIVSTGFKSTAIIAVGSSIITVKPLTRLSLAEIQTGSSNENLNLNLQAGRVKVEVKPPAGTKTNFTVRSPSATASVRGTSFWFDTRNIKVGEGKVLFSGNNGLAVTVSAGGESSVGSNGNASNPNDKLVESLQPPPPVGTESLPPSASSGSGEITASIEYPPPN